jgi:hypothetical protein
VHETESEGFGCREEPETGAWRRLVPYVSLNTIGVKRRRQLALALDRNDPALVTAGDDDVRTLVGGHRLLFHPPAVLAKEVGDEVLELAPTVLARRVRIGKRGGHGFTLATLVIVAVVILMAALTVEVKARPVFDLANLKENCHMLLEEARWNRYSKARRCGSESSGIQEAAVDPVYFSRAPWAVATIWLSTASIWGEERFPQERT